MSEKMMPEIRASALADFSSCMSVQYRKTKSWQVATGFTRDQYCHELDADSGALAEFACQVDASCFFCSFCIGSVDDSDRYAFPEVYQLVDELGGKASSFVPQLLSFFPSVSSNTPPSNQEPWVIQFFAYGFPSSVAL